MKFYVVVLALCFVVIGTSALKCYRYCKGEGCTKYPRGLPVVECEKDEFACTSYRYFRDGFVALGCTNRKCKSNYEYKCLDCDTDLCNKELSDDTEENND